MGSTENLFSVPVAETEVSAAYRRPSNSLATVVLAHGAGAGKDHPFITGFADALNNLNIATLRFNFPYMDERKKFPDRPPLAIATWQAVMGEALKLSAGEPLYAAGKSFGGRMASMAVVEGMDTAGLIFLGYPLHAPKKPEKLRDGHLYGLKVPMLFMQGTKDPFAQAEFLEPVVKCLGVNAKLKWFDGGDHSFKVARSKRTMQQDGAQLSAAVEEFINNNSAGAPS
ncbi:dienelactone hydrolase [Arthrobacter sp. MYb227]|uniref:alpha/beta hydrolase family protein n=1 Tax=Arthrobacter sp. MYb227 TaxID=1848601 RepID=UPI000CFB83DE|nr:alpha/beta family hydrolase [Arthrobacter sp. MYb227]PQZ89589.1 dienelactone hydrolase [Arthrobacter sp. MYb227]